MDTSKTHRRGTTFQELEVGKFETVQTVPQGGALQARRLSSNAVQFYWRYSYRGRSYRVPIGLYDPSSPPKRLAPTSHGFSLAAAMERCAEMARVHHDKVNEGGFAAHTADKQRAYEERQNQREQSEGQTLSRLLAAYLDHLREKSQRSHNDVRSIFGLHVEAAFPALAARPANTIQTGEITDMMRRLSQAGKGRTANKLRSYLRAAYQCAVDVNSLASIPEQFKAFNVVTNPVASTKRDASKDKADKNPLSIEQMRLYWKLLQEVPGAKGAALRLHVATGGQRVEQLVKAKVTDLGGDSLTIFDSKGRPGQGPRRHTLPLLPEALAILGELPRGEGAEFLLSTDGGKTHISGATMSNWAQQVAASAIPGFQLKRIRSGVETLLASAGVSREVRGHLQSHGLTGVQTRHYDAHDYMPEKRQALETLLHHLQPKPTERLRAEGARKGSKEARGFPFDKAT